MTATENLNILKRQERFYRSRIQELNKKNRIIESADKFVNQVKIMGLTTDKWDQFSVNLIDEPSSFAQCQKIIEQTANSKYYYFKPEVLHIKVSQDATKLADDSKNADSDGTLSDLIINLNGLFFIRK
ncbi:MAG: hypothetical protein GY699_26895 [Desulfobacteraceae bacterium]|nr:hypothetical protein [Desulfobacteraceae bacterium]